MANNWIRKTLFIVFAAMFILPSLKLTPVHSQSIIWPLAYVQSPTLNVRVGPSKIYAPIDQLVSDYSVEIHAQSPNGWLLVQWKGERGDVHRGWISGAPEYVNIGDSDALAELPIFDPFAPLTQTAAEILQQNILLRLSPVQPVTIIAPASITVYGISSPLGDPVAQVSAGSQLQVVGRDSLSVRHNWIVFIPSGIGYVVPNALKNVGGLEELPTFSLDEWMDGFIPPMHELAQAFGVDLGVNFYVDDPLWLKVVNREFAKGILHDPLYWIWQEWDRGQRDFRHIERDLSKMTEMVSIRGQHLVFPSSFPSWFPELTASERFDLILTHITDILGRTKGRIDEWVVLNEPASHESLPMLTDEEIVAIYEHVRSLEPDVLLLYNDWGNESTGGPNTATTRHHVQLLRERGLLDAVGFQMHLNVWQPLNMADTISIMREFELPVYFTELNITLSGWPGSQRERMTRLAEMYRETVWTCYLSGVCEDISFWDFGDAWAWGENPQNLWATEDADLTPFDEFMQPKLAYYAIQTALLQIALAEGYQLPTSEVTGS